MPTNLKLDDKTIERAVKLGQFKTKQEAVNAALAEFVTRRNRLKALELAGQIDFDSYARHLPITRHPFRLRPR